MIRTVIKVQRKIMSQISRRNGKRKRRLEGRKQESRSMGDGEMFATFKM